MELLDRTLVPTTIRKWAADMLPELITLLSDEKGEISKTDAISVAIRNEINRLTPAMVPEKESASHREGE